MSDDSIQLVDYDSNWPRLADKEIAILHELLDSYPWVQDIQHFGSTAIPGLAAKPIIDIYIGVTSVDQARQAINLIVKLGYLFWDKNPNKEKLFFVKGMTPFGTQRTHHIHIGKFGSDHWNAVIFFRDYLRSHPEEASKYLSLKFKLAKEFQHDREAYTEGKTDYITSLLRKAGFQGLVRR